jgi:hypothetical protein
MSVFFDADARPLRDVLLGRYITPTARWLLGSVNSPYLLPQAANSNWECALGIEFLLNIRSELNDAELVDAIPLKVSQTARWMMDQAVTDADGMLSWECVTWDTAVCVRALMRTINELPQQFSTAEIRRVESVSQKALSWLVTRFRSWEREIMYPFGPADVAQILEALVYVNTHAPELIEGLPASEPDSHLLPWPEATVIDEIAAYLVTAKEDLPPNMIAIDPPEAVAFWSDFFQSGEVIDCLASYLRYCRRSVFHDECRRLMVTCIRYFERHQVDGKWGAHADTCRALYGYLRATHAIPEAGQEDHLVMKALRWMCDEKQTFSDGSFLHTPFVTVFYAAALWEAYVHWPLAAKPVNTVYDVALWSAPVRATEERGLRLALQIEADAQARGKRRTEARFRALRERILGAVVLLAVLVAGTVGALLLDLLTLHVSGHVGDAPTLTEFAAVVVAVALAAAGLATRNLRG